jgi:tryptophan synthase
LANGVKMDDCFRYVTEARAAGLKAPIVLMGYTNPFVSYGEEKLATRSLEVGVEGFIVVDMPPDDAGLFSAALEARGLSFIPLVAPTSADARLKLLAGIAKGYVYAVSLTGVTGSRSELSPELPAFVGRVRKAFGADFPIVVGFGLSTPEHVQQVSGMGADGAVVGSSVIQEIRKHSTLDAQAAALTLYVKHITGR